MKYFELELNDRTIKFRLRASDCVVIEEKTGQKLLDFMQDYAIKSIITMLRYLRRGEVENFNEKDTYALYDELVDAGYTLEKIMYDIIFEALVVSGFLEASQLSEIKEKKEESKQKLAERVLTDLQQ